MLMSKIFERFVEKTPVSVMARAAMEHAMAPEALDALFVKHANKQYTRELLFSSVVDLMGVVVSKVVGPMSGARATAASHIAREKSNSGSLSGFCKWMRMMEKVPCVPPVGQPIVAGWFGYPGWTI